jgi:hypothetical protein
MFEVAHASLGLQELLVAALPAGSAVRRYYNDTYETSMRWNFGILRLMKSQ